MPKVVWKLEEWLEARGKTRYQLAAVMDGEHKSNLTTLYRLGDARRIDYGTLERVIEGLRRLTGEPVTVADLLEYEE